VCWGKGGHGSVDARHDLCLRTEGQWHGPGGLGADRPEWLCLPLSDRRPQGGEGWREIQCRHPRARRLGGRMRGGAPVLAVDGFCLLWAHRISKKTECSHSQNQAIWKHLSKTSETLNCFS